MEVTAVLDILNKRVKYPQMDKRIKRWADVYHDISLHTLGASPHFHVNGVLVTPTAYYGKPYQDRFNYHLLNRHPRESDATRNWRFANYKPLTKEAFSTVSDLVTGAIFQDGNYSIEINKKEDYDYIWGKNFHGNNLIGYFTNIGYGHMVEDPNGIFVRIPKKAWHEYEDREEVEPDIWFINSCHLRYISNDEVVFIDEEDDTAWHIDRLTIWRYRKVKGKGQYEIAPEDSEGYYAHMLGKLPITIAGGTWNSKGYFDSFYDKAKAAADTFIDVFSAEQIINKETAYPFITEVAEECPGCHGLKQIQICKTCATATSNCTCDSPIYDVKDCGTCGGSGTKPSDPAKRRIVPADQMGNPAVRIDSADSRHAEQAAKLTDRIKKALLEALHLNLIDEAQSGAAKAIDQDRQHKFISKVSNHIFDNLIADSVHDIIAYRNVTTSGDGMLKPAVYDFKIVKPTQFQIKTADHLLLEFDTAKKVAMPKYILGQQALDYVDKQYSGNDVIRKKTSLINQMDKLAHDTTDEQLSKKISGSITTEDMMFSDTLPLIIDEIVREKGDEWFLDAEYAKVKSEVDRLRPNYIKPPSEMQEQANEGLRRDDNGKPIE